MSADTYDLTAERMLDATVDGVFDAYTNPDAGRTVFAGGPDWVVEVTCDLRVGGVWSITSGPPGGAAYREANRFTLIDRPRRLAFRSELTMPDGSSLERDVEVTFTSGDGSRTRMTIVQKGFPTQQSGTRSERAFLACLIGWNAWPRGGRSVRSPGPRSAAPRPVQPSPSPRARRRTAKYHCNKEQVSRCKTDRWLH